MHLIIIHVSQSWDKPDEYSLVWNGHTNLTTSVSVNSHGLDGYDVGVRVRLDEISLFYLRLS